MSIFNQELLINSIKIFVILDIAVLFCIVIYLLMYLLDLVKWGKKEAAIYFTKRHVKIILYLVAVSIIIQFLYFKTSHIKLEGYRCTDLSIRYNDNNIDIESTEVKERFLEVFNDRKINRTLFVKGSVAVEDTIFLDFNVIKGNEARSLHVTINEDFSRFYDFSKIAYIYKFNDDEQDLYEKVLKLAGMSPY